MDGFVETPVGPVPRVTTTLTARDRFGTVRARIGIARNNYKIIPGLYCVGVPKPESPVLVTANYKLSFDALRKELTGLSAWILAVDTRGINVWCAAGKGTFSTEEIAFQVKAMHLAEIVSHRELILPQLAAAGVAAYELKKKCGFKGMFGPILAAQISRFLHNGKQADETMRMVTFTLRERLVLVPVEIGLLWKFLIIALAAIFLLSGISPDVYSFAASWARGSAAATATLLALLAGTIATPILLPWVPGRQFWFKGMQVGALTGLAAALLSSARSNIIGSIGLWVWTVVAASYLAMNFTGATPYTSLSGVEKEMRRGLPLQIGGAVLALILWVAAPFVG